jgi:hypothetical protein
MNIKQIGWKTVDRIQLAQDGVQHCIFVTRVYTTSSIKAAISHQLSINQFPVDENLLIPCFYGPLRTLKSSDF